MNDREINDDLIDVSDDKNVDIKLDIDSSHESSIEYNQESQEIGNDSYSNMQNNDISAIADNIMSCPGLFRFRILYSGCLYSDLCVCCGVPIR